MKNKKNRWIIALLIIIIVVCIVFIFSSGTTVSSTETPVTVSTHTTSSKTPTGATISAVALTPAPVDQYTVTYTSSGFSPKTLQVPKGKSVKFVNNSDTSLLIVADDQNSSLLNQINQPKAIGQGGVYTFDFVYAAVWAFHNASNPSDHGNIVVY